MNSITDFQNKLSRAPGTSLHRQLFIVLRDEIMRGHYAAGALIPKEEDLCTQFAVSRITVRRALADLEQLGLVEKRQGRGTFVSATLPEKRPLATLGFLDGLKQVSNATTVQSLKFEQIKPDADIAQQLNLAEGEDVVHIIRLRSQDAAPLMITDTWVPVRLAAKITEKAVDKKPLYELLIAQGVEFGRVIQEITATAASPMQAKLLNTGIGQPILKLSRLMYDVDQQPVQLLHVFLNPERSRILMDFPVNAIDKLTAGSIVHDGVPMSAHS